MVLDWLEQSHRVSALPKLWEDTVSPDHFTIRAMLTDKESHSNITAMLMLTDKTKS